VLGFSVRQQLQRFFSLSWLVSVVFPGCQDNFQVSTLTVRTSDEPGKAGMCVLMMSGLIPAK
jgi:hypothetical protein